VTRRREVVRTLSLRPVRCLGCVRGVRVAAAGGAAADLRVRPLERDDQDGEAARVAPLPPL
jgi:hypothetical protein